MRKVKERAHLRRDETKQNGKFFITIQMNKKGKNISSL
jgi:hypothetical protein